MLGMTDSDGLRGGPTVHPTSTYLRHTNVPFSHPSEVYPQKDGRKVRSRDELPLTSGPAARPTHTRPREENRRGARTPPSSSSRPAARPSRLLATRRPKARVSHNRHVRPGGSRARRPPGRRPAGSGRGTGGRAPGSPRRTWGDPVLWAHPMVLRRNPRRAWGDPERKSLDELWNSALPGARGEI